MIRKNILSLQGYDIPCIYNVSGTEEKTVVISHGLGSSKESPTVMALVEKLEAADMGYIAYDFPGHGDSPVDGEDFLVSNCINDLAAIATFAGELLPGGEIMYFSSSFGAYINLLFLSRRYKAEQSKRIGGFEAPKSFLRAAAVNMPGIFKERETPELVELLKNPGYFMLEEGYERPLKITAEFCRELYENDLYEKYEKGSGRLTMIHGIEDETASVEDAKAFARMAGADLIIIEGGFHRLMDEDQMEAVLAKAMEVFK